MYMYICIYIYIYIYMLYIKYYILYNYVCMPVSVFVCLLVSLQFIRPNKPNDKKYKIARLYICTCIYTLGLCIRLTNNLT